jgi:PAS domain S-box-containing protein
MSDQNVLIKLSIDPCMQKAASRLEEKEVAIKLANEYGPLLDNFHDVIFITDKAGHFLFVNKASGQRTGVPAEILIGRHFLEIIDPKYHEFAQSSFQKAIKGEKVIPAIEMERQTASGVGRSFMRTMMWWVFWWFLAMLRTASSRRKHSKEPVTNWKCE